jgi:DNA primase
MQVDVVKLFENWSLDGIRVQTTHKGEEVWACCPFHDESRPSFSVNLFSGKWKCFGCQARGRTIQSLVAKYNGISMEEAALILQTLDVPNISDTKKALVKMLEEKTKPKTLASRPPVDHTYIRYISQEPPNYMLARGFTEETLHKAKIGFDWSSNAVTIPVMEHNKCRFIIRRYVEPNAQPRYRYPRGVNKSDYLYGASENALQYRGANIVLCEGSLDALWLQQHGYKSVAMLGSSLSQKQTEKLLDLAPKSITIFFDNDDAGYDALEQAIEILQKNGFHSIYFAIYPPHTKGYDPQKLDKKQIKTAINKRKHFKQLVA